MAFARARQGHSTRTNVAYIVHSGNARRVAARAYMDASTAIVHHRVVSTSFVPKLYDAASRQVMRKVVETTHRILCKVMQHNLDDAEYRKIFDYDPRLAELILVPRGYDALLPFARFDIFLDENTGDVAFCEFNGDGSSGMNENREITHSWSKRPRSRNSPSVTTLKPASCSTRGPRPFHPPPRPARPFHMTRLLNGIVAFGSALLPAVTLIAVEHSGARLWRAAGWCSRLFARWAHGRPCVVPGRWAWGMSADVSSQA